MTTDKLQKLRDKRKALDAQIQKIENQRRQLSKKVEDHRKVLVGAAMLEWARHDNENSKILMRELDAFLTRNFERALFGLPPLHTGKTDKAA